MVINPKLLKRFQRGGYVNPYDIPGTGGGQQVFGDPGTGIEGETSGVESGPGFGGGTGGGGSGYYTGLIDPGQEHTYVPPTEEYEPPDPWESDETTDEAEDWIQAETLTGELLNQYYLGTGFTNEDIESMLFDWMQGNIEGQQEGGQLELNDFTDWLVGQGFLTTEEPVEEEAQVEEDPLTGGAVGGGMLQEGYTDPVTGETVAITEGLHGAQYDETTGLWTDPATGQQWSEEGGIAQYQGADDPSLVSSNILEHVGAADLTPEMQQYLQSFLGENWMQGAEIMQTVTNPAHTAAMNEYNESGSNLTFQAWHQDEYGTSAPQPTTTQGTGTHQGVDFSDPASVQNWLQSAIDPETGDTYLGPEVTLGGLRGISEDMLEKTESGYYDEAREAGRENIISKLNINPQHLGQALNPELLKEQMRSGYRQEALALEEGIDKKQAGAQGDVMDIMTEWSDIFTTGG